MLSYVLPSYLHFKHIKLSISSGCNVIVEKPPILNLSDFKNRKFRKKSKKNVFVYFNSRR